MVNRMDHFFQRIARFSFINVTAESADEACISFDARYDSSLPKVGRQLLHTLRFRQCNTGV
jgi:hypothetical protein